MSDSSSSNTSSSSDDSSVEEEQVQQAESDHEASEDNRVESRQSEEASMEKASEKAESSKQSSSDESDDDSVIGHKKKNKPPVDASDLFGDLSDDDGDDKSSEAAEKREDDEDEAADAEEGAEEPGVIERLIQVEMPSVRFDLGKDLFYVRLPNFLSIDPRPFDPETYQGEGVDEEVLDEEGRTRLKMSVENTIRWQFTRETADDGSETITRRSNARIVKWSDGSMSLHLGAEIFDIHVMPEQQDYNHMYVKQGNGLVGQAVFRKKLIFRPHSTDSLTHRKMTLSMADKTSRVQQVKEMPLGRLKNPEMNKDKLIKQEEDALKATVRRESQQRRVRDRFSIRSLERGMGGDDEEGTISLSSIKRRAMTGGNRGGRTREDDDFIDDEYDSSDEPSIHDSEEEEVGASLTASAKQKKRRLVVDDE